jgi:hypothetical protein
VIDGYVLQSTIDKSVVAFVQLVQDFLENKLPSMSVQDLSQGHVLSYRKDNSLLGGATHRFQGLEKTGGMLESLELEKEPGKPSIVRMQQHGNVDTNEELQRQKVPHLEESRADDEGRTQAHEIHHRESKIGRSRCCKSQSLRFKACEVIMKEK